MLTARQRKIHDEVCDCKRPDEEIIFDATCASCGKPSGKSVFIHKGEDVLCDKCFGRQIARILKR